MAALLRLVLSQYFLNTYKSYCIKDLRPFFSRLFKTCGLCMVKAKYANTLHDCMTLNPVIDGEKSSCSVKLPKTTQGHDLKSILQPDLVCNEAALGENINEAFINVMKDYRSFHMTSRRPYWCTKTMKWRPCWCTKPTLWELNSFLM